MFNQRFSTLSYVLRTSPVFIAVFLMRFSFAFTVVALQWILPIPVQRGIVSAAYPVMEMITGLLFGFLADKVGRKWIVVGGLFASSLVTLSFTFTKSLPVLVLIHGLQGICAAAIITSTLASLTDLAKTETRGREMGAYDFCTIGGYGLGFVFALVLIGGNASKALLPFYFGSAIALIGGIVSLLLLKDVSGRFAVPVSLRANLAKMMANGKSVGLLLTWFVLTILIGVGLTYTRELASALLSGTRISIFSPGFVEHPSAIEFILVALMLFGVVLLAFSQTTFGRMSDRFGRERIVLLGQVSILGLFVVLVTLFTLHFNRLVALPFLVLFGIGLLAFTPAGLAELADIAPETGRGATMGLYSLTIGAGTVFAPLAGGALISGFGVLPGFSILFSVCIIIMAGVMIPKLFRI